MLGWRVGDLEESKIIQTELIELTTLKPKIVGDVNWVV